VDPTWLSNRTAIAGIGATEFSKDSGRSEMRLAVEAIHAALADAGLGPEDVDGLVSYTVDGNAETEIARNLGIPALTFFSRIGFGGGAAGAVIQQAAMAVATGVARTVVVYRRSTSAPGIASGPACTTSGRARRPAPRRRCSAGTCPSGS
jgi:acetyl-CoA acetyltransferase